MLALIALTVLSQGEQPMPPPIPREFRGVWVATVDNIDWPSRRDLSTEQQKREMLAILDKAQRLHFNAIVLQIRPSADALYPSKLGPWSEYLTGLQGRAPSPFYDPLAFAVAEAHKRGLELHAWFNPYRANHPAQKGPLAANHISKLDPRVVKKYGPYQWMDPGEPFVQKHTLDVIIDVVKRYDIDGVHIDDYFYPYKEKDPKTGELMDFPDGASWSLYRGPMNRGDWRRHNVDTFIERLYKAIKKAKRWVKFGISPFGIYRPGVPPTIKANVDQYADLYADALKWLQNGWCDYFTPQLYWKISQTPQAYPVLLNWWIDSNSNGRHIWPGLYTSRLFESTPKWPAKEIVDQVLLTRKTPGAGGTVHFSMKAMMLDSGGIDSALLNGPYAKPAFVPSTPWLGGDGPDGVAARLGSDGVVSWKSREHLFATTFFVRNSWTPWMPTGGKSVVPPTGATWTAIVAFDRVGLSSPMIQVRVAD